jgi:hypothetical protein
MSSSIVMLTFIADSRKRGYDAESRLERFLRQQGNTIPEIPDNAQSGVRSMSPATEARGNHEEIVNGSTTAPALPGYRHVQPPAAQHVTSFGSQDGSKSSNISSTPFQAVSTIDAAHQYFRNNIQMPAVTQPQNEYPYGSSSLDHDYIARLPFKLREYENKMSEMESTIQRLMYELALTNRTMAIQEKSMRDMETLLRLHGFVSSTLQNSTAELPPPAQQMGKLRTLANGVQVLAQVAFDSYPSPTSGSNDEVKQDESETIKEEPGESNTQGFQNGDAVVGDRIRSDTASVVDAHVHSEYSFQDGIAADGAPSI